MIDHFKLDSYHNPTLFIDDDKMFVAGSEDHIVSTFSKSRIIMSLMMLCAWQGQFNEVNEDAGSFL